MVHLKGYPWNIFDMFCCLKYNGVAQNVLPLEIRWKKENVLFKI